MEQERIKKRRSKRLKEARARKNCELLRKGWAVMISPDGKTERWLNPQQRAEDSKLRAKKHQEWIRNGGYDKMLHDVREKARQFVGAYTAEDEELWRSLLAYQTGICGGRLCLRDNRLRPLDLIRAMRSDEWNNWPELTQDQWKAAL